MSTQGPNFPTAATGNTNTIGGGTAVWTNPTNIELNDGNNATRVTSSIITTDDLDGTGFGFSIPAGATVNGILLEIAYGDGAGAGDIIEKNVRLLKAGVAAGTDKSTGASFPAALTTISYGGSADLWGTTWTPSDINNATFGAAFVCRNTSGSILTASVNFFRITVTFTPAVTSTSQMFKMF
jgi:hypothetical protein